MTTHSCATM